jgi:hypothetical protein
MDASERRRIVEELASSFGQAVDVTPSPDQPLHVLLPSVPLLPPWASPARALVRFVNWPDVRPEFWIDMDVLTSSGEPPRSSSEQLVVGGSWRQFSYAFTWPQQPTTATRAVLLWLNRFREAA